MTNQKKTLEEMIERFIEGDHSVGVYESIEQYMTEAYQLGRTQAIEECIEVTRTLQISIDFDDNNIFDCGESDIMHYFQDKGRRFVLESLNNLLTK
jgi:hypothetical protein